MPDTFRRPLVAVFFTNVSACSAHHMQMWIRAGHQIAASYQSAKPARARWRRDTLRAIVAPQFSLKQSARQNGFPLAVTPRQLHDPGFLEDLARLKADVLISVAFPQRIPEKVTALFPHGGVNVHPALLPQYRGPQPVQVMAIDNALHRFGGVTLHRIAPGFDEGDIIAQLPATKEDLAQPAWHAIWFARLGARLIVTKLIDYCEGSLPPSPQPEGNWRYARLMLSDLRLSMNMDVDTLALRADVLGAFGKLSIDIDGKTYEISRFHTASAKSGGVPKIGWFHVEFDAANGRVALRRQERAEKRLRPLRTISRLRRLDREQRAWLEQMGDE